MDPSWEMAHEFFVDLLKSLLIFHRFTMDRSKKSGAENQSVTGPAPP
jgi:hypothetical protein